MAALSPKVAANLADKIYFVQDEYTAKAIFNRAEFSGAEGASVRLDAKVGMLWRRATDAFGLFSRGAGPYKDDLFLIFRGSTTANKGADWISNARIGLQPSATGLPVHIGFNQIFKSLLPEIRDFLSHNSGSVGTIHCIGHSLGGAVANLAADWVSRNQRREVKLYTFGAPRPGIEWFARSLGNRLREGNIHRVYHKTDPVPMVPIFPFAHAPVSDQGYQIESSEALVSAAAHDIKRYYRSVRDSSWEALHGALAPFQVDHIIEQWLRSDTIPNRADSRIWEWVNSALIWVLKRIFNGALFLAQNAFVGTFTLVDRLAWLLKSGIDLGKEGGYWVNRLMRKILQVLGMGVEGLKNLTQAFIRQVLTRLMERVAEEVRAALRRIN